MSRLVSVSDLRVGFGKRPEALAALEGAGAITAAATCSTLSAVKQEVKELRRTWYIMQILIDAPLLPRGACYAAR